MKDKKKKTLDRRGFIKLVGGAAATLGAASCLPHVEGDWESCEVTEPVTTMPLSHRVVEVFAEGAVIKVENRSVIVADVVKQMFEAGLLALTGQSTLEAAWAAVLPERQPGERIALKANALNADVPTSPQVLAAMVDSLRNDHQAAAEDVFVWDRTERELELAGILPGELGVACRGTIVSASDDSGPGYEYESACLNGRKIHLSRVLTEEVDHLLNVAVLKNHFAARFTGCLKNHYGSFANPYDFHEGCQEHIALLNTLPQIADVSRLFVIDALFAVTVGDTNKPADSEPKRILLSFDPVAIDKRGEEIRDEIRLSNGQEAGEPAAYIDFAAELGLGSTEYERVTIEI